MKNNLISTNIDEEKKVDVIANSRDYDGVVVEIVDQEDGETLYTIEAENADLRVIK